MVEGWNLWIYKSVRDKSSNIFVNSSVGRSVALKASTDMYVSRKLREVGKVKLNCSACSITASHARTSA